MIERKPFSPGEILQEEFLEPYGLSQGALAQAIGVHRRRINEIINNRRAITPDTALRLGKFFRMTPEYWLNIQMKIDLWEAEHDKNFVKVINSIKPIKEIREEH